MSGVFIPPVTPEEIRRCREQTGVGSEMAREMIRREHIEGAIHTSKDIEDLKVCLLAILHLGARR